MTQPEAAAIVSKATRCTEATLMAFGIHGIVPQMGSGCLQHLRDKGYKLRPFGNTISLPSMYKLGQAIDRFIKKDTGYLIYTHEHAMALIDGILIDTARQGFDGRKIEHIWEVTK